MFAAVVAQATTSGIPPEALVGFGAASPIVAVMGWLLHRAETRADRLEQELLDTLRTTIPVAQESSAAIRGSTEALNALTVEIRTTGRPGP